MIAGRIFNTSPSFTLDPRSIEVTLDEWHLVEFRNIKWSQGIYDYYVDAQLQASDVAMADQDGSLVSLVVSGGNFAYVDEVMIKQSVRVEFTGVGWKSAVSPDETDAETLKTGP